MDDERNPERVARKAGGFLWFVGIVLTAAAVYWAVPAGHGRPSSVTVFGINPPAAAAAGYPGLRVRPLSQMAAADSLG